MTDFLRGFARRVENQCRGDWTALPIFRSIWYQYTAYISHAALQRGPHDRRRSGGVDVATSITAMQHLAEKLEQGFVGRGVLRIPVAGDITKLPFAEGLTAFVRKLAQEVVFRAGHMPGDRKSVV